MGLNIAFGLTSRWITNTTETSQKLVLFEFDTDLSKFWNFVQVWFFSHALVRDQAFQPQKFLNLIKIWRLICNSLRRSWEFRELVDLSNVKYQSLKIEHRRLLLKMFLSKVKLLLSIEWYSGMEIAAKLDMFCGCRKKIFMSIYWRIVLGSPVSSYHSKKCCRKVKILPGSVV